MAENTQPETPDESRPRIQSEGIRNRGMHTVFASEESKQERAIVVFSPARVKIQPFKTTEIVQKLSELLPIMCTCNRKQLKNRQRCGSCNGILLNLFDDSPDKPNVGGPFKIQWKKPIAKGATGCAIFECENAGQKRKCAAKVMDIYLYESYAKELEILQSLEEKTYLLRYITNWSEFSRLIVVLEYCDVDIKQYIDQCKNGTEENFNLSLMDIAKNMIEGIFQLHQLKIVHRDIKPSNFMLKRCSDRTIVKVCDFGLSRKYDRDRSTTAGGTLDFGAPEVLMAIRDRKTIRPNFKSDIFSLGLVLFYTLTKGNHPFGNEAEYNIRNNIGPSMQKLLPSEQNENEIGLSQEEKINSRNLIIWMLQHKEVSRPNIDDVKYHPFLWNYAEKAKFFEEVFKQFKTYVETPLETIDESRNGADAEHLRFLFEEDCSIEKKKKMLEVYPASLLSDTSNGNEERKFVITNETVSEFLANFGRKKTCGEYVESCSSVADLIRLFRNKIQHANEYERNKRNMFGLGTPKDWKMFYTYFTKANPQLLLRVYQIFGNDKELLDFKKEMLQQDRAPKSPPTSYLNAAAKQIALMWSAFHVKFVIFITIAAVMCVLALAFLEKLQHISLL